MNYLPFDLYCVLEKIKEQISISKKKKLDLSIDYGPNIKNKEARIQQTLRLETRSLLGRYLDSVYWSEKSMGLEENEKVLDTLEEVSALFGRNPFHHVIEGRIAWVVKQAKEKDLMIPDKFKRYLNFEYKPWNDPHLNYSSIEDILKAEPERRDAIPPEFRK